MIPIKTNKKKDGFEIDEYRYKTLKNAPNTVRCTIKTFKFFLKIAKVESHTKTITTTHLPQP
jgi:hypothetical protein